MTVLEVRSLSAYEKGQIEDMVMAMVDAVEMIVQKIDEKVAAFNDEDFSSD
jgi:hypothetical protein